MRRSGTRWWFVFLAFLAAACTADDSRPSAPGVRFSPEEYEAGDFYAVPWPSALRMTGGVVDLERLPAREHHFILSTYLPVLEHRVTGFSPNGAILFFLDTTLATETLPKDARESLEADAGVRLVNVEPASARFGETIPVEVRFFPFGGTFQPNNTLTVLPVAGFPMAPGERHAAIVLRTVKVPGGGALGSSEAMRDLLRDPRSMPAAEFEVLAAALDKLGLDAANVAAATVFRTSDPTAAVRRAREVMLRASPPPVTTNVAQDPYRPSHRSWWPGCPTWSTAAPPELVEGKFKLPSFLRGPMPYTTLGSGTFVFDAEGDPVIQGYEEVTFTLSVPALPQPAGGYPVVVYMHGAGGTRHSFVSDGTACALAERGLAGIAIDFPLHGDRNPPPKHDPVFLLVNPENVPAALDVENQAAIDLFSLTRLIPALAIPPGVLGREVRLRPHDYGFIGHSQGTFVGVGYLAFETEVVAGLLSGSGAHFITFITDRIAGQSIDMQMLLGIEGDAVEDGIAVLLGIPGEVPDRFHFLFTLIQTIADPVDPVNYAPHVLLFTDKPKHMYQSAGFRDAYDPPAVNQALATALGLDIAAPLGMPYPNLELRGGKLLSPPIAGNRTIRGKAYTAVNSQFPEGDHWVYLNDGVARTQGTDFMASALADAKAGVPARCGWAGGGLVCP